MSLAVLLLNDLDLLIQTEQGQVYSESGFAQLTKQGIDTGEKARAKAWLQPQTAYNQYWNQLNQTPLAVKHPYARHHADIAYAQLRHLLESVGAPEKLIVATPGYLSDQQLSLLLGLLKALEVQVMGIIDSAIAAAIDYPLARVIIEVQLYQTVITEIGHKGDRIEILNQQCVPDLGIAQLHNLVATYVSHQLIDNYRYDPLHSSLAEQQIYDLIPSWLEQLTQYTEITATIDSPQGELAIIIHRTQIGELFAKRIGSLEAPLLKVSPDAIYFSQDAAIIPRLVQRFDGCSVLDNPSLVNACFKSAEQFSRDQLQRTTAVTRLATPSARESVAKPTAIESRATHLLYRYCAYPIHSPISIYCDGQQLCIASKLDKNADLVLALEKDKLEVISQQFNLEVTLPASNRKGERVQIGEQSLLLIGVDSG